MHVCVDVRSATRRVAESASAWDIIRCAFLSAGILITDGTAGLGGWGVQSVR